MDIKDCRLLVTLYELKSLSKAAEKLYTSQPSLSYKLRNIEAEFKTIITLRSSSGIEFTPKGEQLVSYAKEQLERYEHICSELCNEKELTGKISISAVLSQTQFTLPALLKNFQKEHSGVSFEVSSNKSSHVISELASRKSQVGFFCGNKIEFLQQEALLVQCCYAVSAYPFELSDLEHMPCIDFDADPMSTNMLNNWWFERFPRPQNSFMRVQNGALAYEMVKHGLGYCLFFNRFYWSSNQNLNYRKLYMKSGKPLERTDWIALSVSSEKEFRAAKAFYDFSIDYSRDRNAKLPELGDTNIP